MWPPGRGNLVDVGRLVVASALVSLGILGTACGTDNKPLGGPRSQPTSSVASTSTTRTVSPSTTTTTTPPPGDFRSVQWGNVSVPGAVCDTSTPIQLNQGNATINTPAGMSWGGTPQVVIMEAPSGSPTVVYGDLYGTGQEVAALDVFCDNTGGTADGQLQNSWSSSLTQWERFRLLPL
jgi:hypothetical protein